MIPLVRSIQSLSPSTKVRQLLLQWVTSLVLFIPLTAYTQAVTGEQIPRFSRALNTYSGGDKVASITGQDTALREGLSAAAELIADPLRASRVRTALGALKPDAANVVRGAREAALYREVSSSVVLVVGDDGFGSGSLISASGDVLTNYHVVGNADSVGVIFKPAQEGDEITKADVIRAKVLRVDEVADLALLRVAQVPPAVKPLQLGSLSTVSVGSDVHAIGHPTGEAWTYTRGFVSQIRRNYAWTTESRLQHKASVIQTQTPINPGNSGGPLLDESGKLVGVNSFKGDGEGLNFAVSVEEVQRLRAATTNRLAKRVQPSPNAAAAKSCEPRELSRSRVNDPAGVAVAMDSDCDGALDTVALIPDVASMPLIILMDSNKDGEADLTLIDDRRDGIVDRSLHDTNFDGEDDLVGYYRNGEERPYRFEPVRR